MSGDDRADLAYTTGLLRAIYGDGRGLMRARFGVEEDEQRSFSYPLEISDAALALVANRARTCELSTGLYRDGSSEQPWMAAAFITELAELSGVGATPPYAWKIRDEDLYVGVWPCQTGSPDSFPEGACDLDAEIPPWIELPDDLCIRRVEVDGDAAVLGAPAKSREIVRSEVGSSVDALPMSHTLADLLNAPMRPLRWTVEGLQVAGGNSMLVAPAKAGKTTLALNLMRCLADGEPFLGRFGTDLGSGRIAYLNYEVTEAQMLAWFRQMQIKNADRIVPATLRGRRALLSSAEFTEHLVDRLSGHQVRYLIVDPFARAHDANENDNTEISRVLEGIDELKRAAQVRDVLLVHHTGHDQKGPLDRARGRGLWHARRFQSGDTSPRARPVRFLEPRVTKTTRSPALPSFDSFPMVDVRVDAAHGEGSP